MQRFASECNKIKSNCVMEAKTVVLDNNAEELFDIYRYCIEQLHCDTDKSSMAKSLLPIDELLFESFQFILPVVETKNPDEY